MKEQITDPFVIMLINMIIVFAVLYALGWIIRLIRYLDPTKLKQPQEAPPAAQAPAVLAPAAAPTEQDDLEIIAVISAALSAYGYSSSQIASIRLVGGQSWTTAARVGAVNVRNNM